MESQQPEDQYVEGRAMVRIALVSLLFLVMVLCYVVYGQIEQIVFDIGQVSAEHPQVAVAMGSRLVLWLVLVSGGVALAVAVYLYSLSIRTKREARFPPLGFPVAFRTPLKTGESALAEARRLVFGAVLLGCQPVAGLVFWFWFTGGVL